MVSVFSTMELQQRSHPMTQHLIEQYYEHVLGVPAGTNENQNKSLVYRNHAFNAANNGSTNTNDNNEKEDVSVIASQSPLSESRSDSMSSSICSSPNSHKSFSDNDNENTDMTAIEEGDASIWTKMKSLLYGVFVGDYEKDLLIEKVQAHKQHAMSYDEWSSASLELDQLTNKWKWKAKKESVLYDYSLIETFTNQMKEARIKEDYPQLLYLIRTTWVRNLGNMGNVNLYRHSHVGTKYLVDDYMEESKRALEVLVNSDLDDSYLINILQQTRRNIGRTALVLSGGGTFGLFHIGVLATLFELDLLPRVISGSSAGAIVASILSVHYKEEIPALLENVLNSDFNIFKDDNKKSESENLLIKISRFFKNGTWFDNKHLVDTMIGFLGDLTFREAYNRTGKILNITVSPASLFEQPRLLNNLTAPNVLIWSAVCASCSLPGIFPSSPLYEKDPKTGEKREWTGSSSVKFVDGSVDNDLPISRLSEMFNIDHIIACQVNVHVFPFLKLSLSCVGGEIEDEFSARLKQNLQKVYNFMANEVIHLLEVGSEIGIAKNTLTKFRSVLSQRYSGDITILPDMNTLFKIRELLSNPTKQFLLREITNGARATWPKISIIQNHCGQEFALDKAISFLKGKIIISSSIKNPLQFTDTPVGLINAYNSPKGPSDTNYPLKKTRTDPVNGELEEIGNVLDDNLLESESTNSLSLLRENSLTSSNTPKLRMTVYSTPQKNHRRRKSDSGTRPRQNGKSLSFSLASPNPRSLRSMNWYNTYSPVSKKKRSTGHIFFPIENRSLISPEQEKASQLPLTSLTDQSPFIVRPNSSRLEHHIRRRPSRRSYSSNYTKGRKVSAPASSGRVESAHEDFDIDINKTIVDANKVEGLNDNYIVKPTEYRPHLANSASNIDNDDGKMDYIDPILQRFETLESLESIRGISPKHHVTNESQN